MANEWIRTTLLTAVLSTTLVGVSSCNDEQVLYEQEGTKEVQVAQASQPASQPAAEMPAGHPSMGEMMGGSSGMPSGHPSMDQMMDGSAELPAGHPQINQGEGGQMMMRFAEPPADRETLPADVARTKATLFGISFDVPASWKEVPKGELGMMRAAQWQVPAPDGTDRGAELVAYYFGRDQGGSAVANVSRWLGQLDLSDEVKPQIYQQKVDSLNVTETYGVGTLKASMMGGSGEALENSGLYGIIIEGGPEGSVFLKMTGSQAAVDAATPALVTLVNSLETSGASESSSEESKPDDVQDWSQGRMKRPELKKLQPVEDRKLEVSE
ncbi:hypothetical protein KQI84_03740 [bacterium]|nr:hypothetical protein [bacterium]